MGALSKFSKLWTLNKSWAAVLIIAASLSVGVLSKVVTKKNDSAAEQLAEKVLSEYGINYDFSPDDEDAAPKGSE
jgi:hypothetical protein